MEFYYGVVIRIVTAAPLFNAPTPELVVICTDKREHWVTAALPAAVVQQFGDSSRLGPVIVADMPVEVGSVNPQGLV